MIHLKNYPCKNIIQMHISEGTQTSLFNFFNAYTIQKVIKITEIIAFSPILNEKQLYPHHFHCR